MLLAAVLGGCGGAGESSASAAGSANSLALSEQVLFFERKVWRLTAGDLSSPVSASPRLRLRHDSGERRPRRLIEEELRSPILGSAKARPQRLISYHLAVVELRHDKVKQSIERLAERGAISLPQSEEVSNDSPGL